MLGDAVSDRGVVFVDTACMTEFAHGGEIRGAQLDDFARCLAGLELERSARRAVLSDVVLLQYAPGFELEATIIDSRLTSIGFVALQSQADLVPTLSGAAFESLRTGGARVLASTPALERDVAAHKHALGWMKLCIDETGTITDSQLREATSPAAGRAFMALAQTWSFKPFVLGDRPIPVCAMVDFAYPAGARGDGMRLPPALPPMDNPPTFVPPTTIGKSITGLIFTGPSDDERRAMLRAGVSTAKATAAFCTHPDGTVANLWMIRPSGYKGFDDRIVQMVRGWGFTPYLDEGTPVALCSMTTVNYHQR